MENTYLHREPQSPPWGSMRETLTQGERTRLFLLLHACLISDLAVALALAKALA